MQLMAQVHNHPTVVEALTLLYSDKPLRGLEPAIDQNN